MKMPILQAHLRELSSFLKETPELEQNHLVDVLKKLTKMQSEVVEQIRS